MGTNNAIYITELQTTYTLPEEVTLNSNHTKSYIDTLMVLNKLPFNGLDIYYADNIWDFSSAIKLNIHKSSLKFNFGLMNNSVFTNDMKNFILLTLLENKIKIQTIHNRYLTIKDFFLFAENNYHVYHVEDITVPIVKAFLQKIRDEDSVTKLHDVKSSLRAFYMQYSANFKDITSKGLLALFEQDDAKAYRAYQYSKRSKPIPKEYFNKMLSACITVSNDENQTLSNRGLRAFISFSVKQDYVLVKFLDFVQIVYEQQLFSTEKKLTILNIVHGNERKETMYPLLLLHMSMN